MKTVRPKDKAARRLPVDPGKLNMGNTYDTARAYYYDIEFRCIGCGSNETWTAAQQKWWYEEAGGYYFATAVRCRSCRRVERARKERARAVSGHTMQKDSGVDKTNYDFET